MRGYSEANLAVRRCQHTGIFGGMLSNGSKVAQT
jgi:hypothetical protein